MGVFELTDASAAGSSMLEHPVPRPRNGKLLGLQILRFLAAFTVVLFHIGSGYQIEFGNAVNLFAFGAFGVDVFFVLSGFIIAMTTDPARGTWHFCRRRLVRIVPLYWTLTLGIAVIGLALPSLLNSTIVSPEALLKSLFFIPYERLDGAVQPLLFLGWTLNYEVFFYAIYAACLLGGLRSPLAPVAVVVLLVIAGQLFPFDSVVWRFYSSPLMIEFAMGVLIYLIYARQPQAFGGRTTLLAGAAVALYVLLRLVPNVPWLIAGAAPAALLVTAFIAFTPGRSRWLSLLAVFGDASYSLYLSHPYIIQVLSKLAPADLSIPLQVALGLLASALCIAVSILLYRFIELRAQRLLMPRRVVA